MKLKLRRFIIRVVIMIGAVGALLIFLVTSALAAIPTKYEPDLIAIDILGATDFEQNAPFDC